MSKIKTEHVVIRNENLFCMNCGSSQAIPFPMEIPVFAAMGKAFGKSHATCPKTWEPPTPNGQLSELGKANWWMANGERGISSETIWHTITGTPIRSRFGEMPPSDPDDFRRCFLLLKAVPEWKAKLHLLKPLSKTWSNLVDNWDKLTEMLEEQMKTKKANGMYEFMQTLTVR